ncbi:FMN reductase [Leifsonia shinshuensis]|uniref:FMN reductase n=1 Tax=Leifsonia shinshuensis TaxID=150026 RepID=A0A7G6Y9L6_9MICO|nr:FMN reductase [Leifsonia shinshuensis]QNE35181.1 FMN reductase [Leifsonia shinshuensis]
MAHAPHVVGVSGSPTAPSRTTVLVDEVARSFAEATGGTSTTIELAPLLGELGAAPFRSGLSPRVQEALEAVESADVIVVGSPAYRATYTGLFKLFFDHIGQYALVDKPIVLTATGGSDRHALLVEHQMRPLFGFFQSLTLPLGIYASESDFTDYAISSDDLRERINTTVSRTLPLIRSHIDPESLYATADFARPDAF